jgi:hypothetical protein
MASLKKLENMVDGMNLKEVPLHHVCEACIEGKHQRTSFPKDEASRASKLLELVHSDVCGPMKTASRGGARYIVSFIDDFSRKTHVYLLKVKGEVFDKFKAYKALVVATPLWPSVGVKPNTWKSWRLGVFRDS